MQPEELAASVSRLFERSPAFPGESLAIDLIANPKAGGFTRSAYSRQHMAELAQLESRAASLDPRGAPTSLELHCTERSGHAADIMRGILEASKSDKPGQRRIIITAGGDGTSLETAAALVELPESERGRFALLRLPMGTGNDGSEGRNLGVCLARILGQMAFIPRRAIRVVPAPAGGKDILWSFNIASVGLDAFVCEMTNRLKTHLPGDSYKFWVDVASVSYDRVWPPAPLTVRGFDEAGQETVSFTNPCLLLAFGVSGRRQYGSNKPILPDDDNVCAVFQMSLFKKLAFKDRIASGKHRSLGPEVLKLFSASRLRLEYDRGILLQREGEVTELAASDFPLVIEISEPVYNVLEPAARSS
jgi:diacylglycerol kinase family enzyme